MNLSAARSFLALTSICILLGVWWTIAVSAPAAEAIGFRLSVGAFLLFFLPGAIWGEILGWTADHVLETIALSFALSICIAILPLPLVLGFGLPVTVWIACILLTVTGGLLILLRRWRHGGGNYGLLNPFLKWRGVAESLNACASLLLICFLAATTYQWGENITDIGGEKLLHLMFVRLYAELPLDVSRMGIVPGATPPNIVHFWEFLLAGWARLVNVDPFSLFVRARFIIPVLGLSGLYLLIREVFPERKMAHTIYWGAALLSLFGLSLQAPSSIGTLITSNDYYRGVTAYLGTVHHTDAAMDILLPLVTGLTLRTWRQPSLKEISAFFGVLTATFMWHPREYFQVGLYFGIATVVMLVLYWRRVEKKEVMRWSKVAVALIAVAILFFALMKAFPQSDAVKGGYDEMGIKSVALERSVSAENLLGLRSPFNFPVHLVLAAISAPEEVRSQEEMSADLNSTWHYDLWLILSGVALVVLVLVGDSHTHRFAIFFALLWFLLTSWNFSMLLLIAATYSEFLMTIPRYIYLFAPIVIAAATVALWSWLANKGIQWINAIGFLAGILAASLGFRGWAAVGYPWVNAATWLLVLSFGVAMIPSVRVWARGTTAVLSQPRSYWPAMIAIAVISGLLLPDGLRRLIDLPSDTTRATGNLFSADNPLGYSEGLISFLRKLAPGNIFAIDNTSIATPTAYSAQHLGLVCFGSILIYTQDCRTVENGTHPFFDIQSIGIIKALDEGKIAAWQYRFDGERAGDSRVGATGLASASAPLWVGGRRGEHEFDIANHGSERSLRVHSVEAGEDGKRDLMFGVSSEKNGFRIASKRGDFLVFVVTVKMVGSGTGEAAISDLTDVEGWRAKKAKFQSIEGWQRHLVVMPAREDIKEQNFSINWVPDGPDGILEVLDFRVAVVSSESAKNWLRISGAHQSAVEYFRKRNIDHILLRKSNYDELMPYLTQHPQTYQMIFDDAKKREAVVEFLAKDSPVAVGRKK